MNLSDVQTIGGAAVVVTILVQLLKRWVHVDYVPILAVVIAVMLVLAATLAAAPTASASVLGNAILVGLLAGASSVGLYNVQQPAGILSSKADNKEEEH